MRIEFIISLISFFIITSCNNQDNHNESVKTSSNVDTIFIRDTIYITNDLNKDWQKDFGLTHDPNIDSIWGKAAAYYLNDENCNGIAFDFYYGYFRPSDNGSTIELLKLACSENNKLRPFYRWCLTKTIQISDGALGELIGVPARQYAEKYPDEFFEYMNNEKNKDKYNLWTKAIQYSGYFDRPDYDNRKQQREALIERMTKNLKLKNVENIERVKIFAKDCEAL